VKPTTKELNEIVRLHDKWYRNETGGSRAYLSCADLRDADLSCASLSCADLRDADLRGADLRDADLRGADLSCANLRGANLRGADLRGAYLWRANLSDADLRGADLRRADLWNADLSDANLSPYQIPQERELIVWKEVAGCLVNLRVPPDAKRTAAIVGRKCRAAFAVVLSIDGADEVASNPLNGVKTTYRVGNTVCADSYNDDPRTECTHGIHFFMTRAEAEDYL